MTSRLSHLAGAGAGLLAIFAVAQASAQDAAHWQGLYGGGQIGYAWGLSPAQFLNNSEGEPGTEIEKIFDVDPDGPNPDTGRPIYARDGEFASGVDSNPTGFVGGVHAGYNFQVTNFVFGIEGDYNWGKMDGTGSASIDPKEGALPDGSELDETPQFLTVKSELDNLASLRARIGISSGPFLVYGTGGVAWVDYKAEAVSPEGYDNPNSDGVQNESGTFRWGENMVGWVAGGGVEYLVSRSFSVRLEALYYDFGTVGFGHDGDLEDIGVEAGNIEAILGEQDVSINQVRIAGSLHLN